MRISLAELIADLASVERELEQLQEAMDNHHVPMSESASERDRQERSNRHGRQRTNGRALKSRRDALLGMIDEALVAERIAAGQGSLEDPPCLFCQGTKREHSALNCPHQHPEATKKRHAGMRDAIAGREQKLNEGDCYDKGYAALLNLGIMVD